MAWFCIVVIGFAAYLYVFLLQPSVIGFQDQEGNSLNRLTDLVIMPGLVSGIVGEEGQRVFMLDRFPILLGVALWLAISGWIGWPIVCFAFRDQLRGNRFDLQAVILAILSGLTILSTATLVVGWGGGLGHRWPLATLVAGLGVVAGMVIRQAASDNPGNELGRPSDRATQKSVKRRTKLAARNRTRDSKPKKQVRDASTRQPDPLAPDTMASLWLARLNPVVTVALAICYLLGSMLPAWEFDVLEYHLQAPKEFVRGGRIEYLDHNVYANMPLGAEMHSLAAMTLVGGERGWWWGGLIGKTITGCFALLAAGLVWCFVRERLGSGSGWCAAGLLLATGGNVHVSLSGLIDMVLGAYMIGALVVLAAIWPKLVAGQGRASQVLLLGLMAGGAAACKYPGFLIVLLPCTLALVVAALGLKNRLQIVAQLGVFTLALAVTCLPWLAKNTIQTGNPVYPLAYEFFGGGGLSEQAVENWQRVHSPQAIDGQPAFSLGALWQSFRQLTVDSPFLNPSLVFLTFVGLAACLRWRSPQSWLLPTCLLIAWSLAIWWFATHRIDRFWLPILPLVAMVAAAGAAQIGRHLSSGLANGIAFAGLCFGLLQVLAGAGPHDNRFVLGLSEIEQEWLGFDALGIITPTAWVNSSLNQNDKVLLIGDALAYQYRVPIVYATCFNPTPGESWLAGMPPETQRQRLDAAGITHILVDWLEIERYRTPGNYGFSSWPTHADIDQMVDEGLLKPVVSPVDPEIVEILEVEQGSRE